MPEVKDPMPPQPKTQEIPALTDRALLEDLSRVVRDGFARVDRRFDALETTVDIQGNAVKDVAGRMTLLEQRVQRGEEERRNDSMPVKLGRVSENDSKQDAAIAKIIVDVARVEDKLDANSVTTEAIKKSVTGFLKEHPSIVASVVTLITTAIGTATFWLASHGGH